MTWWLKPVRLCLPEKFVFPSERQFQVGTRVPSTTKEPGTSRLIFKGCSRGLKTFASAFSIVLMVREMVGCETVKISASSSSVRLCRW